MTITASPDTEMEGVVTTTTRRYVTITTDFKSFLPATASSKTLEVSVGDRVKFDQRESGALVTEVLPRKNSLVRQYQGNKKTLVTNVDRVFIITAVQSAFNTLFVDRVLAVSFAEGLPCTLIVNKIDQGLSQTEQLVDLYSRLGIEVICTSAKFGQGLESLEEILRDPKYNIVAFVGISGVGKTTLLNRFVPDARSRTAEVNERTGLGRQTTTQALGHIFDRGPDKTPLLIVDTPGLQSFGVSHLSYLEVAHSFSEIVKLQGQCEFSDCRHIAERICAVRNAFEDGEFSPTRYRSYIHMIEEIQESEDLEFR